MKCNSGRNSNLASKKKEKTRKKKLNEMVRKARREADKIANVRD